MPLVLGHLGMSFGSASRGGAGAHFAGWMTDTSFIRFDVTAIGTLLVLLAMTLLYNRLIQSRFALSLGLTVVMAGLIDAIQVVPLASEALGIPRHSLTIVWSTNLSRAGAALILIYGGIVLRWGISKNRTHSLMRLLVPGLAMVGLTWAAMTNVKISGAMSGRDISLVNMSLYALAAVLLKPVVNFTRLRSFGMCLLTSFLPLTAGQIWLGYSATSSIDEGFHIAVLLKWFAVMLPVAGLGIDYLNTYHQKSMSGERRYLRSVIDTIPHFIFARDTEGRFTLVNKAVAEFYGQPVHQLEGRHLTEVHKDTRQCLEWLEEDVQTLQDGHTNNIDQTMTTSPDGDSIWIHALKKALPTNGNGLRQVLGVSMDISEQKRAERALADRLRLEQTMAAILKNFIHCTSSDLERRMTRILGQVGRHTQAARCFLYRFSDDQDNASLLFSWRSDTAADNPLPVSIANIHLPWIRRWFDMKMPAVAKSMCDLPEEAAGFLRTWTDEEECAFLAIPIHHNDELFGFLGVDSRLHRSWHKEDSRLLITVIDLFKTVWTKFEMERSLVQAMEAAQASSRAKSEFLANMSHEIRTPMNCVIGITDLLMKMGPTPAQKQYLDMVGQSGDALLTLLNDILDLSKIEAGQLDLENVSINLRDLIEEVVSLIAFNAQSQGLDVVCRFAPGAPDRVMCDPVRLRQVLTNLLNNATKFTHEGHIYLNIEPVGQRDDEVDLLFQVTDTGIGIDDTQLDNIFDKFTQAEAGTTRRFGGTGLGLPISQHLIRMMGGKIRANSRVGEGSTFSFIVPLKVETNLKTEAYQQLALSTADSSLRVLVATAHQLTGETLVEQVRHLGHHCTLANTFDAALAKLKAAHSHKKPCTHILVDKNLSDLELTKMHVQLEALALETEPTAILLCGLADLHQENNLQDLGFSTALAKPVLTNTLSTTLLNGFSQTTQAPSSPQAEIHSDTDTKQGPRILLAEDNPFNQKVAVGMLRLIGCQVDVADNGQEALDRADAHDYDMVFMDCQMPVMDGYEATRCIRELDGPRREVPIIAMTANALSGDRQACFDAGMNDFLSKPITMAVLSDMVAKWNAAVPTEHA